MSLIQAGDKFSTGANISELESSGKSRAQSVAIALSVARKNGAKIPFKSSRKRYGSSIPKIPKI